MELHSKYVPGGPESIYDVDQRVGKITEVIPPFPEDRFLCGFNHIFAGWFFVMNSFILINISDDGRFLANICIIYMVIFYSYLFVVMVITGAYAAGYYGYKVFLLVLF